MKITPLEIRQKNFEKKLRGYDKDEVSAFLISLSNEWERVLDDNKELRIKLDHAQKEVQKLREVESSLFKTLKTAEDTGANLIEQANKAAELHMRETQMNAEAMLNEAKSKAKAIIEKSEVEARAIIEEMQDAVRALEQNYRSLENQRDNLLMELKNISEDILDRMNRTSRQKGEFTIENHTKRVKALVRESEERLNKEKLTVKPIPVKPLDKEVVSVRPRKEAVEVAPAAPAPAAAPAPKPSAPPAAAPKPAPPVAESKKEKGSFFDELDD